MVWLWALEYSAFGVDVWENIGRLKKIQQHLAIWALGPIYYIMINDTSLFGRAELAPHQPLLTQQEAAEILRVCPKTIYTLTKDGALPAVRIGRAVRYDRGDLQRFITARRDGSVI